MAVMSDTGKATGGAAFPRPGQATGMMLRDWFAGQVLPSLIADSDNSYRGLSTPAVAAAAYRYADAMIEARDK